MPQVDKLEAKGKMPKETIEATKKEFSILLLSALLAEDRSKVEIENAIERCQEVGADITKFNEELALRFAAPPPPPPPPPPPAGGLFSKK